MRGCKVVAGVMAVAAVYMNVIELLYTYVLNARYKAKKHSLYRDFSIVIRNNII